MAKLACLLAVAVIAAGCGSSKPKPSAPPTPGPGQVVYQGTEWAVVIDGGKASAQHLVGDAWQPAKQGSVKITVLGPKPGSKGNATTPQVAASLSAGAELTESALWVDGVELLEKGGGLTPTKVTVYGAPNANLKRGKHVLVAYGRTASHGTAVVFRFTVV